MQTRFSNLQLETIVDEATIYMCACPAQVAEQLLQLRKLFAYQQDCISSGSLMETVHHRIAESTVKAHAELEACLEAVLKLEGWDMTTLKMPAGLRELRQQYLNRDKT